MAQVGTGVRRERSCQAGEASTESRVGSLLQVCHWRVRSQQERPAHQRGNSQNQQGAQPSPAQPLTSQGARWFSTLGEVLG